MQLPIEIWLANLNPPAEVQVAFEESVRCFKAGAYRSALVFSYLGWGLTIRHRILSSPCPSGVSASHWQNITAKLRNEHEWDSQAFDCTQMQDKKAVFDISDDLRLQVRYWKDRRNDCAHFKVNDIASPHVEAFWRFIQSNLAKFVLRGSKDDILVQFERHFDPSYTPPGVSVEPVVALIPSAVSESDLPAFLEGLLDRFTSQASGVKLIENDLVTILEEILRQGQSRLVTAVIMLLSSHPQLLLSCLRRNPGRVLLFAQDPALVRNLWMAKLFEEGQQDLHVFAALLRNDLIPLDQMQEAMAWIVNRINNDIPSEGDLSVLLKAGFKEAFEDHAFKRFQIDEFGWGNRNEQTISWFIERFPLSEDISSALCRCFSKANYPYNLKDSLRALMARDQVKREAIVSYAEAKGFAVPKSLL